VTRLSCAQSSLHQTSSPRCSPCTRLLPQISLKACRPLNTATFGTEQRYFAFTSGSIRQRLQSKQGRLLPCPLDACYFERSMSGRDSCWQACQLQQDIKPSVRSTCMSCRMGPAHLLWMCKHPFWCCMTLMPRPSLCQMWLLQQRARPGSSFQSASQHGRCSCPTAPGTQCLRSQVYCSASARMSAILRV